MPDDETQPETQPWFAAGLRFSCTQCGNCCTGPEGYVWFDDDEAEAMAAKLGVTVADFRRRFARTINGRWSLKESLRDGQYDCIFLRRDDTGRALCTIYDARPQQCRTWPFWPENLAAEKNWRLAGKRCPGMDEGKLYPAEEVRLVRDSNPRE